MATKELYFEDVPENIPYVTYLAKNCRATIYAKEGAGPTVVIRDELKHVPINSDQNLVNIQNTVQDNEKNYVLVGYGNLPPAESKAGKNFVKMRINLPKLVGQNAELLNEYPNYKKAKAAKPAIAE